MSPKNTKAKAQEIVNFYKVDPELAHGKEDDLLIEFVNWISVCGNKKQIEIARVLLDLNRMDVTRWYA